MSNKISSHTITTYAIYVAFFLFMGLTPYIGYISIPPVKATLMAIPVAVVTIHKKVIGAIFGCFMFGITSMLAAVLYGSVFVVSPYNWGYGFLFLFVGRLLILLPLLPTILILEKYFKDNLISLKALIYALVISIFNTLSIITLIYIVNSGTVKISGNSNGYWAFIALIGKNIAVEWTLPPIVSAALGSTILKISTREKQVKSAKW